MSVSLTGRSMPPPEIGSIVKSGYRRKGYALEASKLVIHYWIETFGLQRNLSCITEEV